MLALILALFAAAPKPHAPPAGACAPPHDAKDTSPGSYQKPLPFKPDAGPLRTRKSATELTADEQQKLHLAYEKLRALPDSDARSWAGQASFHCAFCAGSDADQIHGSWLFFPWHRAYLYFHEKILGSLIGDPSFALPYWNWEKDRTVPATYSAPSCVDSTRHSAPPGSAPLQMPDSIVGPVIIQQALAPSAAARFLGTATQSGVAEGAPHGPVHIWVAGGDKPDMGLLQTAAKDPIFYAHHANIDRLWWRWIKAGHTNATDKAWLARSWKFVGADGKWYSIAVKDVLDPEHSLKSAYQAPAGEAVHKPPMGLVAKAGVPKKPAPIVVSTGASLGDSPATLQIKLPPPPKSLPKLGGPAPVHVLHIDSIAVPSHKSAMVRVFVNDPDATPETPVTDKHFAGYVVAVAKAPQGQGHAHKPFNAALELTAEQAALIEEAGHLQVTLVPVDVQGRAPAGMELKHGKVWLGIGE